MNRAFSLRRGYAVVHPMFFRKAPTRLEELVHPFCVEANCDVPDSFPTSTEAPDYSRAQWTEQRLQSLADREFLSRPYTVNGVAYVCPPALEARWRSEVRRSLAIAFAALRLLAP